MMPVVSSNINVELHRINGGSRGNSRSNANAAYSTNVSQSQQFTQGSMAAQVITNQAIAHENNRVQSRGQSRGNYQSYGPV